MKEIVLSVKGMKCDGCVNTVKDIVGGVKGVFSVEVTLSSGRVVVRADESVKEKDIVNLVQKKTSYKTRLE